MKVLSDKRIGETRLMNCGMKATIVDYKNAENIDIEFEDGVVVTYKAYNSFKNGNIKHPHIHSYKDRTGETKLMNCGLKATIIKYNGSNDIDVRFENGKVVNHCSYNSFKIGSIRCPEVRDKRFKGYERLGETKVMHCGVNAKIVDYKSNDDITVLFDDNVSKRGVYSSFRRGRIGHPNIDLLKGGTGMFSTFNLTGIDHRLKNPEDVYYKCECIICKYKGVLKPTEMLEHKCSK